MSDILNNSRTRREFSKFFLNRTEISGLQGVSCEFANQLGALRFIGSENSHVLAAGPQQGNLTLDLIPITADPFINFATGNSGFNGYILKSKDNTADNYSFISGYITSYRHSCSVGELPRTEISISVLDNIGKLSGYSVASTADLSDIYSSSLTYYILDEDGNRILGEDGQYISYEHDTQIDPAGSPCKIATFGTVDLSLDDFTSDRVLNYELTINSNRNPIYKLGQQTPSRVEIDYPIEVTFNCLIDINDYSPSSLKDFPCNQRIKNLSLILKDHETYEPYITYGFNDLFLIGQNYNTTVEGNKQLNLQYKTYLAKPFVSTGISPETTCDGAGNPFTTSSTTSTTTVEPPCSPLSPCNYTEDTGIIYGELYNEVVQQGDNYQAFQHKNIFLYDGNDNYYGYIVLFRWEYNYTTEEGGECFGYEWKIKEFISANNTELSWPSLGQPFPWNPNCSIFQAELLNDSFQTTIEIKLPDDSIKIFCICVQCPYEQCQPPTTTTTSTSSSSTSTTSSSTTSSTTTSSTTTSSTTTSSTTTTTPTTTTTTSTTTPTTTTTTSTTTPTTTTTTTTSTTTTTTTTTSSTTTSTTTPPPKCGCADFSGSVVEKDCYGGWFDVDRGQWCLYLYSMTCGNSYNLGDGFSSDNPADIQEIIDHLNAGCSPCVWTKYAVDTGGGCYNITVTKSGCC